VERPELAEGNVQAEAREARYAAAERLRLARGLDWVATGHTRTDLAETVLYRLATSPGRRALLGLRERRGRVIRPLLSLDREEARRLVTEAGLPFADDPTNTEPVFARNRIRNEVLPVLREIGPETGGSPRRGRSPVPRSRGRSAATPSRLCIRRSAAWSYGVWPSAPRVVRCPSEGRARRRSGGSSTSPRVV
jgi:tRNA(Ile)-lysidine synthase TilS/MesJ